MAEHQPHAALRLSGRDTEHDVVAAREFGDRICGAGIERLDLLAGLADRTRCEPVLLGKPAGGKPRAPFPSLVKASTIDKPTTDSRTARSGGESPWNA